MEYYSNEEIPEILYHYTSLETLFAILSGIFTEKSYVGDTSYFYMRATHASFLNDDKEGRLLPIALKELGENEQKIAILDSLCGYPFILSLSKLNDDLNMWRCYADNARGICIGIKTNQLNEHEDIKKCEYISIEELLDIFNTENVKDMINDNDVTNIARFLNQAFYYKDKTFIAEQEWRLFITDLTDKFCYSNNKIIPYKEIKIPTSALYSITTGPKCDYEKNIFSIRRLLKTKISGDELNRIKFLQSNVPLV